MKILPKIIGILNVTPDSFSDGGQFLDPKHALDQALKMQSEGASIIDIGGESTRPNAQPIDSKEELKRILPIIETLQGVLSIPISIDTYKAEVAQHALSAGASLVNDIWGLQGDPAMATVVAKYNSKIIIMHNQKGTSYASPIIDEINTFFKKSISIAQNAGIPLERIILDPGIGFGKTVEQNKYVIKHLNQFHQHNRPLLLGTSRKSFIGKTLDLPENQRLEGTLATTVYGIMQGVEYFRVHDVTAHSRTLKMIESILDACTETK